MPYRVESEIMTEVHRGPFGIFKRMVVESLPLGNLHNGQDLELVSRGGEWSDLLITC